MRQGRGITFSIPMKNAADWTALAARDIPPINESASIYLHNLFLQVQADAFEHAASLVDEQLKDIDVKGPGIFLRQTARAIWPGQVQQAAANPLSAADFGGTMPQPEPPPVTGNR